MMLKICPDPVDVQDLQFKLQCRLKIFENKDVDVYASPSLLSCASRFGLLFVGSNSPHLQVIQTKCVENYSPKEKDIVNYPRRNIALPSPPKHICVNCDSTLLAVVVEKDKCSTVIFYDVLSFLKYNVVIIKEARLSPTPGIYITETNWNPALPPIFTACKSDGSLGVYEIQGNSININELPAAAEATSFCWSPKGKQIAVGSKNGKITQYKPDLKAVKIINEPPLEGAHSLISLQWVSNYQFIGIYQSTASEGAAKLIVVDAPKTGETSYTNYEDVCYSGSSRPPQFYMILQQHWNILMVASSNSTELGVLGSSGDTWTQWMISDSARAELPLSSDHQETLPVGLALDISSTRPLPWNESSIPPCPYLLILSHQGVLCIFNIVNLKEGIPSICTPPDTVSDMSGLQQFVTVSNISLPQNIPATMKATTPVAPIAATTQASTLGSKMLTQPQPTYAAPGSLFGAKTTESNKNLFGGQAVLTPISPQQPTTQASLFGGQTVITPINKVQTSTPNTTASNDKYASIFAAVSAPAITPASMQSKPVILSTPTAPKSEPPHEQTVIQPKPSISSSKSTEYKTAVDLKIKGEKDALLAQMIRDECMSLESELKALLQQGKASKIEIGSDGEKVEMVTKIESLQEFVREIVDISGAENVEVHCLKQNLIQCWAWFEEARSRYNCSKDETISLLLKFQPLDSATEKRQQDMRKLIYYIESQIAQASKALDEQWDNFQDYAKKTHRTKMPTMETIFQTMVRQNAVLQRQNYILKDIASRLKSKTREVRGPSLLLSLENTKDLENDFKHLQLDHTQDIYQLQYERILKRTKNLSVSKTNKLRNLLKNRQVPHVTAIKPQLVSSLMLQSPDSKRKQLISSLLSLSTQVSPVQKSTNLPRQLNFLHSTPIREPSVEITPTETPPNTPQIDSKTFTFKKIEKSNSAVGVTTTASGFVPLVKSASVFSNLNQGNVSQPSLPTHTLSAFVPTTQITLSAGTANKPFSFTPTVTTVTTVLKTVMTTGAETVPAFSLGSTSTALPKFGGTTVSKTISLSMTTSNIVKTSTPPVKTTLPQFSFGGSMTITPVTNTKKPESAVPIFGATSTTKPAFSFSILAKSEPSTGKTETTPPATTNAAPLFGSLSQANKPLFGPTTSSGTFTFGDGTSTSKLSAFTALTTGPPVTTATVPITSVPKPDGSATSMSQPSIFATNLSSTESGLGKTANSVFGNLATANSTPANTTTTKSGSFFSSTVSSTKPHTFFGTTATSTNTATSAVMTSSSTFGSSVITTKPSAFGATSPITTQSTVSATSSLADSTSAATVSVTTSSTPSLFVTPLTTTATTTAESTKSSTTASTTAAVTIPSLFSESTPTSIFTSTPVSITAAAVSTIATPVSTTVQTTSVFGSSTITKSSIFGSTQASIFATPTSPKTTQASIFGGASTAQPTTFATSASTMTASSIFGGTTTQSSIFASPTSTTTVSSIFGSTQPSLFGKPTSPTTTSTSFGSATTTQPSIFGTSTTTTTSGSIFGGNTATHSTIFGTPTPITTSSIFGSTTTTQSSIFGTPISSSTTKPSIFGTAATLAQPSIFGTTSPASTQQGSIFGGNTGTNQTSIFGTPAITQTSVFGGTASASTTKPSVFGSTTSAPAPQPSAFAASSVTSTQSSLFPSSTAASPFGSGFGAAVTSASSSPFGQSTSIFGTPKTTASPFVSAFGSPNTPVFGSTPATTASIFGQPATFGSGSTSVFGTPTTSSNIFGSAANGSTFGTASSSANVFGSPAVSSPSFSFAGAANNTGNTGSFGFGNLNVGNTATTSSSIFGGGATFGSSAPVANPFGTTTEQKSPFGGSSNIFASPASTSSSVFGSGTGSAFGSNTQSGFGTSTFGSPSAFSQQSAFGQSSFGSSSFGSTPGPFSSGTGVGQSGFGATTTFQKPSGFGSSPVFGGSPQPAFGAAPSFGGSPAFGAAPGFGSPSKVFGSNTSTAAFGTPASTNTGFGNLANQNTVGFGNLAQQASTPSTAQFSGSSSFSSWR